MYTFCQGADDVGRLSGVGMLGKMSRNLEITHLNFIRDNDVHVRFLGSFCGLCIYNGICHSELNLTGEQAYLVLSDM
jgi:hypothetical protein